MSTISLFHVNAFSRQPFGGNPAVVALGPSQPDVTLLAMAVEFNLSETAFLVPLGHARYQLRWFTPELEVDLCGHGTLAAAHVLWQTGAVAEDEVIHFETRSGELLARREGEWIWLDFPRIAPAPLELDPAYAAAVGCQPLQILAWRQVLAGAGQRGGGSCAHPRFSRSACAARSRPDGDGALERPGP